jgi:hypothetical protein
MSSTLTIPADVVPDVRDGLLSLIGNATEQFEELLLSGDRDRRPDWYVPVRQMLEGVFALLDHVGWSSAGPRREIEIDVSKHGLRIMEAIEAGLSGLADQLDEADINDQRCATEGLPLKKQQLIEQNQMVRDFAAVLEQALGDA